MKKRAKKLKAKMSAQAESFVKPLSDVTSTAPPTKSQSVKLVEDIDSAIKQKSYGVLDSLLTKLWRAFHNNNEVRSAFIFLWADKILSESWWTVQKHQKHQYFSFHIRTAT